MQSGRILRTLGLYEKVALGECYEMGLDDLEMFVNLMRFKKLAVKAPHRPVMTRAELRARFDSS